MSSNIDFPSKIPQDIKDINFVLEWALHSKSSKRLYVVIDPRTNSIGLTQNKKLATPTKKIAIWVNQFSKQAVQNNSVDRSALRSLNDRLFEVGKMFKNSKGFFQKIIDRIFGDKISKDIDETYVGIEKRLATYGMQKRPKFFVEFDKAGKREKKSHKDMEQTLSYEKHAQNIKADKLKQDGIIDHFEKVKNLEDPSAQDITRAFNDQFSKVFDAKWAPEKAAYMLVTSVFDDLLQEDSDLIETMSPEETLSWFKKQLLLNIVAKNSETLVMDRDTFRDLMGNKVKDGMGNKIPESIDTGSSQVRKLIKEYNENSWTNGMEKTLEYDIMDGKSLAKMKSALLPIINSEDFNSALLKYFSHLKDS